MLLAWVLVVASASTAIWFVIERAGSAVSTSPAAMGRISAAAAPSTPGMRPTGGAVSTPVTGPDQKTDTWTGAAGQLTATCRDGLATLNTVLPADGYRVEGRQGNQTAILHVDFDGPREFAVTITCASDGPVFRVQGGD